MQLFLLLLLLLIAANFYRQEQQPQTMATACVCTGACAHATVCVASGG